MLWEIKVICKSTANVEDYDIPDSLPNESYIEGHSARKQDSHPHVVILYKFGSFFQSVCVTERKALVQNVLSVPLWEGDCVFFFHHHRRFLGRESKCRREIKCMKSGKVLSVKSVKEISPIVIETLILKIQWED